MGPGNWGRGRGSGIENGKRVMEKKSGKGKRTKRKGEEEEEKKLGEKIGKMQNNQIKTSVMLQSMFQSDYSHTSVSGSSVTFLSELQSLLDASVLALHSKLDLASV